jgi:hypothetical protein
VQRAHNGPSRDDAVAERTAFVRTAITGRKNAVAEIENGDLAIANLHGASFTRGDVLQGGDTYPSALSHTSTFSITVIGANCVGVRGD